VKSPQKKKIAGEKKRAGSNAKNPSRAAEKGRLGDASTSRGKKARLVLKVSKKKKHPFEKGLGKRKLD